MKAISVAFLLVTQAIAAQSLLLGKWKVEMIDPPRPLVFEFMENDIFSITEIDTQAETTYHSYQYDPAKKTLSLGELYSIEYETRIEMINSKQFRLYFHQSMADAMIEEMDINLPSQEETEALNTVGKAFIAQFAAGMKRLITSIPIVEARKLY